MAYLDVYPRINDAYREGKSLMQLEGKELGVLTPGGPEDIQFRSFFWDGVITILTVWYTMAKHNLLPKDLLFLHYLWALMFVCLYSKNGKDLCALVGGPDPKTVWKKTWPLVFGLNKLNCVVVSFLFIDLLYYKTTKFQPLL